MVPASARIEILGTKRKTTGCNGIDVMGSARDMTRYCWPKFNVHDENRRRGGMGKQRYTTEEIIHKLGEVNVLIGQGQTVIPRPRRRRLYGFRSKTSCRLNDIRDAPCSD